MNHSFISITTQSSSGSDRKIFMILGSLVMLTIIGFIPGLAIFIFGLVLRKVTCPDCGKDVCVYRGAYSFLCHYCQAPVALRDNKWHVAE